MVKNLFVVLFLLSFSFITKSQNVEIQYPITIKEANEDNYFGTVVSDPYRWMENINSLQVKNWVKEENKLTKRYLKKLNYLDLLKELIDKSATVRYNVLTKSGKYYFHFRYNNIYTSPSLYYKVIPEGESFEIVNPIFYSRGNQDRTSIQEYSVSGNSEYLAFSVSHNGSDWREIRIVKMNTRKKLPDILKWVKFSSIEWKGNGFYYCRYDVPEKGTELTGINANYKVYYHELNTLQESDKLIYAEPQIVNASISVKITSDERFLIISGEKVLDGNVFGRLMYLDFKDTVKQLKEFIVYPASNAKNYEVIDNIGDSLLVKTNQGSSNYQLIRYNPKSINSGSILIPGHKEILGSVSLIGGKIIGVYLKDMIYHALTFDLNGKLINQITYPAGGSVGGFSGTAKDSTTSFYYNSFTYPPIAYQYNLNTLEIKILSKTSVTFDVDKFLTKQIIYKSKDGTSVPMTIVHKKDVVYDGKNPTILYGYGGFGLTKTPFFDPAVIAFMELGGVFALPGLRGGGEYGTKWHEAGKLFNKQNTFDDYIWAAKYLIDNKITSSSKLAAMGSSHGGLLVGAVINQHPDLFKVAVLEVGVYDMLRYHKFTVGGALKDEFGSSEDSLQFSNLYKYSPLHNIKRGKYPAMLIITSDNDDRVPPLHSYKYTATLQELNGKKDPVFLLVQELAGHSGIESLEERIDTKVYTYAFIFNMMGVKLH